MKIRRCSREKIMWGFLEMVENGGKHYGSHYFHPSLKTSLKLLAEKQGIKTSLRTLSRAIRDAKDWGLVWRQCRHIRGQGLKMVCRSTIYRVCDKAKTFMKKTMLRARRFLTPLGVPFVAQDKGNPALKLYGAVGSSVGYLRYLERDGSIWMRNLISGEIKPAPA